MVFLVVFNGILVYIHDFDFGRSPTAILAPKLEKISKDLHELPNDIGAYSAALEENLAKNMESFIKDMYKVKMKLLNLMFI